VDFSGVIYNRIPSFFCLSLILLKCCLIKFQKEPISVTLNAQTEVNPTWVTVTNTLHRLILVAYTCDRYSLRSEELSSEDDRECKSGPEVATTGNSHSEMPSHNELRSNIYTKPIAGYKLDKALDST
jgi:hypothetical protein